MDRDKYEYRRSIWLASTQGGQPRRFTSGRRHQPRWSPEGASWPSRAPGADVKPSRRRGARPGQGQAATVGDAHRWRRGAPPHHAALWRGAPVWSPDGQTLPSPRSGEPDDPEVDDAALDGKHFPRVRTIDRCGTSSTASVTSMSSGRICLALREGRWPGRCGQLTDGDYDGRPRGRPMGASLSPRTAATNAGAGPPPPSGRWISPAARSPA